MNYLDMYAIVNKQSSTRLVLAMAATRSLVNVQLEKKNPLSITVTKRGKYNLRNHKATSSWERKKKHMPPS
jgi:hypothetical protein